jgi:hypothetical protein
MEALQNAGSPNSLFAALGRFLFGVLTDRLGRLDIFSQAGILGENRTRKIVVYS